jgi:hypothetical protein
LLAHREAIHLHFAPLAVETVQLWEYAAMARITLITGFIAGLLLVSGAASAQSPKHLYGSIAHSYGPAAVTATAGTLRDDRSEFVVAAFTDSVGNLKVKAWQDTTTELHKVGEVPAGGQPIVAVAAADLDSSEVVTADVDNEGELVISTWTVGTSGIAALNSYTSPAGTANYETPSLSMTALSATEVVIAYSNSVGELTIQAWNIPAGGEAQPLGTAANGGPVAQVAIAAIDDQTVITATTSTADQTSDLYITTWGVSSVDIEQQNQYVQTDITGVASGISIAAGTVISLSNEVPRLELTRYAVAPVVNLGDYLETLYFKISPSGTISKTGDKLVDGPDDDIRNTAAVMLPTGVPISVFSDAPSSTSGSPNDLEVGWVGYTGVSSTTEVSGMSAGISSVSAAPAGDSFRIAEPFAAVRAYFVTGALYTASGGPPSIGNEGTFHVQVWSYPVVLPLL